MWKVSLEKVGEQPSRAGGDTGTRAWREVCEMRLCVESGRGAGAGPAPQGLLLRAQPLAGAAGAVLMAALGDEVLDGSTYRACAGHSYPYTYLPPAKDKGLAGGGGRRHRGGGYPPASSPSSAGAAPSSFPGCGQLMAAEYLDSYQRAQLMALLAQVGPGLGRLPRGAGSRDVAVQVNPRRDVSVQCSLGRRTLPRRARALGGPAGPGPDGTAGAGGGLASPQPARPGLEQGTRESSTPRPMRFPRTVAVYSRRLTTFLEGAEAAAGEQGPVPRDGEPGPPPARSRGPAQGAGSARTAPQRPQSEAEEAEARIAVRTSWERPVDGQREGEAALRRAPRSPKQPQSAARVQDGEGDRSSPRSPEPYKERLRFQVRSESARQLVRGAREPLDVWPLLLPAFALAVGLLRTRGGARSL